MGYRLGGRGTSDGRDECDEQDGLEGASGLRADPAHSIGPDWPSESVLRQACGRYPGLTVRFAVVMKRRVMFAIFNSP
ncbi:hypothetical protein GCM10022284_08280 [Streptomyces hundungensis]